MGKAKHDRQEQHPNQDAVIIVPLIVVPMLILAIVGFQAASSSLS